MAFQITALEVGQFNHLFAESTESLAKKNIQRMMVDAKPGYPCRVSLQDAEVGDSILLLNFEHLPVDSPYRSAHAIFVRENIAQAADYENEIPDMLLHRMLSVRSFSDAGDLVDAEVCEGKDLQSLIERLFEASAADYLHVHNASRGCYMAKVVRAGQTTGS
jgi:hypothetical protein